MRGPPAERSPAELLSFGVINLDKPPGPSAHQVTGDLRDAVGEHVPEDAYAGEWGAAHSGTLDPKVTGCLPVLLGDATRLAQVFLEGSKEYVAVLELHDDPPSDIEAVVAEFEGRLYQKPPKKSAVSRRLRVREVYDLDLLEVRERQALLRIRCESGTYIRKLCHDIGLALGTGGHMGHLRRTATDPFDDTDLQTMHDLVDALAVLDDGEEGPLRDVVSPAERALTHIPRVTIAHSAAQEVAEGAPVYAPGVIDVDGVDENVTEPLVACYTPDDAAVCLGRLVGDPDTERGTAVELERVLV
ncbi:RNA-guided pseudouridylation complex pseudouridine synthase subunit Cbf5 [Natranaeroarchaeum sulfidigenes]|uniref:Probable tRNA pseudouridine synthase B n=1 Tax=Natranaeroarchaeum sulfidigenes TaxID=2784880 RepID=A0A897MJR2_9EURY|nr:RNA-guided pseudouridylation complex pseudouridine synthase subunit Cbf5 [Natranaeroarchaeum sulfidigenes]QSG02340.1 Pseudouridine synthase [Natranaeroarchaeum sulfidigenes]